MAEQFISWTIEKGKVSPANNFGFDNKLSYNSLMCIKNSNGASMGPWGTSALISAHEEFQPFSVTLCFRLDKSLLAI